MVSKVSFFVTRYFCISLENSRSCFRLFKFRTLSKKGVGSDNQINYKKNNLKCHHLKRCRLRISLEIKTLIKTKLKIVTKLN